MKVPYSRPSITNEDVEAVSAALSSGWLSFGREKDEFEQAFADFVGVTHAISLNSCTSALELSIKARDIRGEVVVPSFTWVATANAVVNAGAIPVFCDVDRDTRNVRAEDIVGVLSERTEAVIVVHYAGQCCPMEEILELCAARGLELIEDCAETLGGTRRGRQAGGFGTGCFSFYPTKAITTGEGGMLTTNDDGLARRVRALSSHGLFSSPPLSGTAHPFKERLSFEHGHNYRMSNILAALGCSQLRRVDAMNALRSTAAARYDEALALVNRPLELPRTSPGNNHVYQMYTILVSAAVRNRVINALWTAGISANVHFDPPAHLHPVFQNFATAPLPKTEQLANELISLPIFPGITHAEQAWVIKALESALADE